MDDRAVRTAMVGAMREAGQAVQAVGTALEVLRASSYERVALVVLDLTRRIWTG